MNKKDFSNLEDQIMSTVSSALNAIDIANLKKDINNRTEDTIEQFKSKFDEYSQKYMGLNKKSKNDISIYINKRPAGNVSGVVCIVFGSIGVVVNSLSVLSLSVAKLFMGSVVIASDIILGVLFLFIVLLIASVGLLLNGINLKKRVKRFKKYVRIMDNNNYISIHDLAKFAKEKERYVLKDLNKMIDLGMFLEGHIDEEKTYFMLNDEVYNDYLNLKKEQITKESKKEKLKEEKFNSKKDETQSTIEIGRSYIEQIKSVRNEFYRDEIATKLDQLIKISNEILNQVEKNPKKAQEVNKFINHYLPITIKLINSYKELNNQSVQGDNIKNAKKEIEKSIDLINKAFENLLDDLFEDVVLDISTDISVLKTLFKQEGLGEEDFKK